MTMPFVSVIVPVHNGAGTIEACVRALLAQDYPRDRYEVLVVDNRSTDGTPELVAREPVRLLREEAIQGSYAARNRGIREARGEVLAFTDADCIAHPGWIRQGVRALAQPGVGCVGGRILAHAPRTLAQRYAAATGALSQEAALWENAFKPAVYTANAFYPKAAVERVGGFDPRVRSGGDADLAWRVQSQLGLSAAFAPEAVVEHEHRARVRDLLRQKRNYGYGSVVNYVKHRQAMGRRTLRHAYWECLGLARRTARLIGAALARCAAGGRRPELREQAALAALDVLAFLAKKAGQLEAAWRYRVWYF